MAKKKRHSDDWLGDSLARQEERNRHLRANLQSDTSAIAAERDALSGLLSLDGLPEPDDEEPVPDLFAAEREANLKQQAGLADFQSELSSLQEQEKRLAQDLFGSPGAQKKRRRR